MSLIITLSTCWYVLKSKFDEKTYLEWIKNIISITNNFNLVIYTDIESLKKLNIKLDNKKIKIIIKPFECFVTYKYKNNWIKNHKNSKLILHKNIDWKLNMLWNEKVFLVNETIKEKYFDTEYYGWCDIGYFRNRENDLHTKYLSKWPNNEKIINKNYIEYGCVQNNKLIYEKLSSDIENHYVNNLKSHPLLNIEEICFAGGFFILNKELIDKFINLYDNKLMYYFKNNFIIKDDQTILLDIIFMNVSLFKIHKENLYKLEEKDKEKKIVKYDNWFMFQRLLL